MSNNSQIVGELDLVQCNFFGYLTFYVTNATVCEGVPLNLEVAKDLLKFTQDVLDNSTVSGSLEVIDMLGHGGCESATTVAHAQFVVNLTAFS